MTRIKPRVINQCSANVFADPDEKIIEVTGPGGGPSALISVRFGNGGLVIEPYRMRGDVQVMEPTRADGTKAQLLPSSRGTDQGAW
jgi:hypothetical protein